MSKEIRQMIDKIKNFKEFLNENKTITSKEELLGKKFYHGTTLETWKNSEGNDYLFVVDEFEVAKNGIFNMTKFLDDNNIKKYKDEN